MDLAEIILIASGLAMDAAAVSLIAAASGFAESARATFRLSFHFGLFQFMMPVLGWFIGSSVSEYFVTIEHWIAFGLLAFVGGRMIYSGIFKPETSWSRDPSREPR